MKKSSSGFSVILVVVLVLLVIGAVGGAYYLGIRKGTGFSLPSLQTLTASPTPTADPTANWKTYTSSKLNLVFKYPPTYTVKESVLGSQDKPLFGVEFSDQNVSLTIFNYATGRGGEGVVQSTQISVDSNGATRFDFGSSITRISSIQVSINNVNKNGNDVTVFYNIKNNKYFSQDQLDTFNQILSTFKFLD